MPKKPPVETLVEGGHVKGSERLLKSARQYFWQNFWSLLKKISSKIYVLVVSEMLRLFFKILTPYEMYSLSVKASV